MDQHLTWNIHIAQIASKISKNVGILSRVAYLLPTHLRLNLYYSLIHPYLSYCNMVWASNYATRLKRLIIIQKRAVRIISGTTSRESTTQIFLRLKIQNPEQIKVIQICEFIFKYKSHALPHTFDGYFQSTAELHRYGVRSAANLRGIPARTNSRKFSIKHAGPVIWNNLPSPIRDANNYHSFKTQLRVHIFPLVI